VGEQAENQARAEPEVARVHHSEDAAMGLRIMKRAAAAATVAILAAAAAGCGSTSGNTATGDSTGTANAAQVSKSSCAATAQAKAAQVSAPLKFSLPPLPKPAGALDLGSKTIAIVTQSTIGVYADSLHGFEAAGKAMGMHVIAYPAGTSAPAWDQAIENAVNRHPDLIVTQGLPLDTISTGIKAAAAAHIPIASMYEAKFGATIPDVKAVLRLPGAQTVTIALWGALAKTKCKLDFGDVHSLLPGDQATIVQTIKSTFAKYCPQTCKLETFDVSGASDATPAVTTAVATGVARDPGIQYVFSDESSDSSYILQALKNERKLGKISVITNGGIPYDDAAVKNPTSGYSGVVDGPSYVYQGWSMMDVALRVLGGWSGIIHIPQRLVLSGSSAANNPIGAFESGYQARFVKFWKSGS
jgi:ABC-type sugar transport system substrate-binding protein